MNLHEYQSKKIFAEYGIPVPTGFPASSADEAASVAGKLGGPTAEGFGAAGSRSCAVAFGS